jgi:hypothetical protein
VNLAAPGARGYRITGAPEDEIGSMVSTAGDVNGDGRRDVLVAGWRRAYVVFSADGSGDVDLAASAARSRAFSAHPHYDLASVAGGHDVTGDSRPDIAIGEARSQYNQDPAPRGYLIAGSAATGAVSLGAPIDPQDGVALGPAAGDGSLRIALPGDVSGDAKSDVLIGDAPYAWLWQPGAPDTTPPETTISAGPVGPARADGSSAPPLIKWTEFQLASNEYSTYECRFDGGTWSACSSPARAPADLPAGPHTFDARAVDRAGNVDPTPASRAWEVPACDPPSAFPEWYAYFEYTPCESVDVDDTANPGQPVVRVDDPLPEPPVRAPRLDGVRMRTPISTWRRAVRTARARCRRAADPARCRGRRLAAARPRVTWQLSAPAKLRLVFGRRADLRRRGFTVRRSAPAGAGRLVLSQAAWKRLRAGRHTAVLRPGAGTAVRVSFRVR